MRAGGPLGLSGAFLVGQVWKLYQNPFGFDGVFRALVSRVHELCWNSVNSNREPTLESL